MKNLTLSITFWLFLVVESSKICEASVFGRLFSNKNSTTDNNHRLQQSSSNNQSQYNQREYSDPTYEPKNQPIKYQNGYQPESHQDFDHRHQIPALNNNKIGIHDFENTNNGDTRIPFWNIAHMVNSIEQIDPMLGNGSNGIEIDISFDKEGFPIESYHGFPCDCGRHCHYRENFVKMVQHIAKICVPPASSNLRLVLLDLKLKELDEKQKIFAGKSLARILHENLYKNYARFVNNNEISSFSKYVSSHANNDYNNRDHISRSISTHSLQNNNDQRYSSNHRRPNASNQSEIVTRQLQKPPVRVVISINHANDSSLIKSFMHYVETNRLDSMKKLVGFDVGMNDELKNISLMWDELAGLTQNIWQGDGLTNCVNLVRPTNRLLKAIAMRNEQEHFRKIYYWTVDVVYQIRGLLRLGPDAVLTNQPHRIAEVLQEPEFKNKYRLATAYDDPFAQYRILPTANKIPFPTVEDAVETIENVKNTSMNFIKTLPEGISAAVKKVLSKSR